MATNTYVALDTQTLSSAAASVTFSNISGSYTDLVLVASVADNAATNVYLQLGNGSIDTASNYSTTVLTGNGTTAYSYRESSQTQILYAFEGTPPASPSFGTYIINLNNYSNTTTYKTTLIRANSASSGTDAIVGLWRSTSAINTIKLSCQGATVYSVGSTFSLYGIAATGAGAKATGGTVYSDSQYYYHAFTSSGTFTPTQSITADCLVIAGGGAGGYANGSSSGGGGAGGLRGLSSQSFTATAYTITVGAGGTSTSSPTYGGKGNTSSLIGGALSISGTGGGGGGGISDNGQQGGSGGGGSNNNQTAGTGNQGGFSPVEGFAGGAGAASFFSSGGGGGASAVGNPGPSSGTGNTGGAGSSAYSTYASATSTGVGGSYAGGGGGGGGSVNAAGGAGGGGTGGISATPSSGTAGTVNTGSGGGGSQGTALVGGAGGSGIVIVRYLKA
jgi:hypothetical protein